MVSAKSDLLKTENLLLKIIIYGDWNCQSMNGSIKKLLLQKKDMKYLLLLFTITFHGQTLHHQMLSSQGLSTKTTNGLLVKQTVGQQGITGSSTNKDYVVIQGYQQSLWAKYIASNKIDAVEGINAIAYPNPFTQTINFQFSKPVTDDITVSIFDILGRLVHEQKKKIDNTILTIDLGRLPTSEYLVRLYTNNLNYYTKIIKQ